jgi:predicted amidohydrolase
MRSRLLGTAVVCLAIAATTFLSAQRKYDLLLKGGHVIDARNGVSAVLDVAIAEGRVAAVAANINATDALKVIDVAGLYVTPGLVDMHVHVYAGTGERGSYAGDNSVYPDGFTLRSGVTTVVDAGSSGWRSFDDFNHRSLEDARARVSEHRRRRHARRPVRAEPGRQSDLEGDAVFRSIRRNRRFAEMNSQISPSSRIACSRAAAHLPPAREETAFSEFRSR